MDLKELLLKDLSARLTYGVKVWYKYYPTNITEQFATSIRLADKKIALSSKFNKEGDWYPIEEAGEILIKPYLRPMSSMTEKEKEELHKLHFSIRYEDWLNRYVKLVNYTYEDPIIKNYPNQKDYIAHDVNETTCANLIDWLNKNHFDYRNLIPKDLALAAPKGMY